MKKFVMFAAIAAGSLAVAACGEKKAEDAATPAAMDSAAAPDASGMASEDAADASTKM